MTRTLGYSKSLLFIFVLPFLLLFRTMLKAVRRKPFWLSIGAVSVLGWAWSMLLSQRRWWVFPERDIVGLRPLPHVPLEEFVIYPIGGAFSIFLYALGSRLTRGGRARRSRLFEALVFGTTAAFLSLALAKMKRRPHYLVSQLVLYNGLNILLSPATAPIISASGVVLSVAVLGTIGFCWDYLAFRYGWWRYNATTGVKIFRIPIEDVNFYLMAPTAAISLYVTLSRRLGAER